MNVLRFKFRNEGHPNPATYAAIDNFFRTRGIDARIGESEDGYVISLMSVCRRDQSSIDDPIAKLVMDANLGEWRLMWLSENFAWTHFDRYDDVMDALRTLLLFYQTAQ